MFLTVTANAALGDPFTLPQIVLPLGISFYTFQQIAYLVDSHGGVVKERNPLDYLFFVSFFPQLIAGPIVHHKEIDAAAAPTRAPCACASTRSAIGLTYFAIGVAKKVVIADRIAPLADGPLRCRRQPAPRSACWRRGLRRSCYALQIYFDFSGYSDMAIGLARLVGIRLPSTSHRPTRPRASSSSGRAGTSR